MNEEEDSDTYGDDDDTSVSSGDSDVAQIEAPLVVVPAWLQVRLSLGLSRSLGLYGYLSILVQCVLCKVDCCIRH